MGFLNRDSKKITSRSKNDDEIFPTKDNLFIRTDLQTVYAGQSDDFIYAPPGSSVHLVEEHLSARLKLLDRYQDLEQHIKIMERAGWQAIDTHSTIDELRKLHDMGLVQTRQELLQAIADNILPQDTNNPIQTLAWITADRPELLLRSCTSYIQFISQSNHTVSYSVFDDSHTQEAGEQNRHNLKNLAASHNIQIKYSGEQEKKAYIAALTELSRQDGLPPDIASFAFFNHHNISLTCGINRNYLLAATCGEKVISLDDDQVCTFITADTEQSDLRFSSEFNPTRFQFFTDSQSLQKQVQTVPVDFITRHQDILGKSIAACISQIDHGQTINVSTVNKELNRLLQNKRARVLVTSAGLYGDSGMSSAASLLTADNKTRDTIMSSKATWHGAIKNRQLIRMAPGLTVSNAPYMMANNIGLDNRQILPPFFPVMRNGDGVFAMLLGKCMPWGMIAHLPYAVMHDPQPAHYNDPGEITQLSIRLSEIVNLLVNSCRPAPNPSLPGDALQHLGGQLVEIAGYPKNDFLEYLRVNHLNHISSYINFLEETGEHYNRQPDFWYRDLEAYIRQIKSCITSEDYMLPSDLTSGLDRSQVLSLTMQLVSHFGHLLTWWPVIIENSKKLKASGISPYTILN